LILLCAFGGYDFSLEYVARYSDRFLPLFYRLTAIWAGQEGSLLFWALCTAGFGVAFLFSRAYAALQTETKLWFWLFYMTIQAFFLLLLTSWSNPFIILSPPVHDGLGLNPLLQHPGMVFHPPLLFLGYAGFTIPACMALAQVQSNGRLKEEAWFVLSRPFTLSAWMLLSAGIILGAWWAYEELGWGGYWAWDPVENASLIPWLVAPAMLHPVILEARSGQMARLNVCLVGLTLASVYLATYIVRTGVVQSLHAFPDGGVGAPLLSFICVCLAITALATASASSAHARSTEISGRHMLLTLVCMLLLILAVVILLGTLWPALSAFFSSAPVTGMSIEGYNRACLPLFALLVLILVFCPWVIRSWRDNLKFLTLLSGVVLCGLIIFRQLTAPYIEWEGLRSMTSPLASASAAAFIISFGLLLWKDRLYRRPTALAAHLVHIGVALMALGVAFSGPCKVEDTLSLRPGESHEMGAFRFTLDELYIGNGPDFHFYEAEIRVERGDSAWAVLAPQHRQDHKREGQNFLNTDTRFSLGTEVYAALLWVDEARGSADLRLSLHPLVNWIWVGGTLLCLAPIIGLVRSRNRKNKDMPCPHPRCPGD
jgi:cytochrome c-type biogenesis protein CcmF